MAMKAFTRNYSDDSTEAGFQFTFECDRCGDGYKSSFIESETYDKGNIIKRGGAGIGIVGSLLGGRADRMSWAIERGADILADKFEERSPEWMKEHENAFNMAQNEARRHFRKCPNCSKWVCLSCWNEEQGLCADCAPNESAYVAQARAQAMKKNIDAAAETATVWKGDLETKITICPVCGKPAGSGKFCNNCGASLSVPKCSVCGAETTPGSRFCQECGADLTKPAAPAAPVGPPKCPGCGTELKPGAKFCGSCGAKV